MKKLENSKFIYIWVLTQIKVRVYRDLNELENINYKVLYGKIKYSIKL